MGKVSDRLTSAKFAKAYSNLVKHLEDGAFYETT